MTRWSGILRAVNRPPTASDPLDILLAHNRWATRRVLEKCRSLSRDQFHQPFPIGPGDRGGLHAILTHVVSAMRRWADRIDGRPVRPSLETPPAGWTQPVDARDRTPDELMLLLDEATEDLRRVIEAARRRGLGSVLSAQLWSPAGMKSHQFTAAGAITHALTHGHHHRAQCLNVLRQLKVPGVSDALPSLDVCDWQHEGEPA